MTSLSRAPRSRILVLACTVMERELSSLRNDFTDIKFFDYGLHRTPENMAVALQKEIDLIGPSSGYERIVLGYGLCSNGIVGVKAREVPLVVPKVHDCISLFLGSVEAYQCESVKCPGTYYLTPGWIERGETPISKYESYVRSYDEETAKWVLNEEMKHYTRVALINTSDYGATDEYRETARKNAEFLSVSYEEIMGSPTLLNQLIRGPWNVSFVLLSAGESITQEMFLED